MGDINKCMQASTLKDYNSDEFGSVMNALFESHGNLINRLYINKLKTAGVRANQLFDYDLKKLDVAHDGMSKIVQKNVGKGLADYEAEMHQFLNEQHNISSPEDQFTIVTQYLLEATARSLFQLSAYEVYRSDETRSLDFKRMLGQSKRGLELILRQEGGIGKQEAKQITTTFVKDVQNAARAHLSEAQSQAGETAKTGVVLQGTFGR